MLGSGVIKTGYFESYVADHSHFEMVRLRLGSPGMTRDRQANLQTDERHEIRYENPQPLLRVRPADSKRCRPGNLRLRQRGGQR